ncbi:MAG: VWA domain-containing protein [Betaproteobacteria bacterium]|nr:VWA domain-containing protein [Betaproteobacteria bacterium]
MSGPAVPRTLPAKGQTPIDPVDDALRALELFSRSPLNFGGLHLRGWHGPRRHALLGWLRRACESAAGGQSAGWHALPHHTEPDQLETGTDLAESLRLGRPVARPGLLARFAGGVVVLQRAERVGPPAVLLDRLALSLDMRDESPWRSLDALAELARAPRGAARRLAAAQPVAPAPSGERGLLELCRAAMLFGIDSMRRVEQASMLARMSAAEARRAPAAGEAASDTLEPRDSDLALAIRQVLLPRARVMPMMAESDEEPAPEQSEPPARPDPPDSPDSPSEPDPPETPSDPETPHAESPADPTDPDPTSLPDGASERLVEAALSALPPGLLAMMASQIGARAAAARGAGSGRESAKGRGRARSVGARRGRPRGQERVHLLATLRAALPWQRLRQASTKRADAAGAGPVAPASRPVARQPVRFHPDDLHVHRERKRRGSTTVFVVDASGSTALQRLAEAKGAVELLLADCYVRRDRVALVSFRGAGAELLLPPTRSLVAARRALTALPGGGGSPIAAGFELAARVAAQLDRSGDDVTVVVLTDGRANLSRDGLPGRERAADEARRVARELAPLATHRVLIDTSVRPEPAAQALAVALAARYVPMPFARARAIRDSIAAATR